VAGDSYFAFKATTQIVTMNINDKKSYSSISSVPFADLSKKQAQRARLIGK
jgi:hypothetical protein